MIDTSRHYSVFEPSEWGRRRIDVIGVGATGSRVALSLAKLGVRNLHVWDGDSVEEHNVANQIYGRNHVGKRKTEALAGMVKDATGLLLRQHRHWQAGTPLGDVVFCMVDSMQVRYELFETLSPSPRTRLVLDSRMGSDIGMLYTYAPADDESLKKYRLSLYSDDDALTETSICGTAISVGPTAEAISGHLVWRFLVFAQHFLHPMSTAPNHIELAIGLRDPAMNCL